jgi:hypothetical protein
MNGIYEKRTGITLQAPRGQELFKEPVTHMNAVVDLRGEV